MPDAHPRHALPNAFEFVDLPDGVTHYRIDGPEDAPTVLLLHGATVPAWEFDRFVPFLLDAGLRCARLDLYGHGYSSRPVAKHGYTLFLRQVMAFLDSVPLGDRVAVLGHSLGSVVAARLVLEDPARFRALVMAAPMWEFLKPGLSRALLAAPGIGELIVHGYIVPMLRRRRARRYRDIDAGRFARLFEEQLGLPGFGRSLLSLMRSGALGRQDDVYRALENIDTPLLLLRGEEDTIVDEAAFSAICKTVTRASVERPEGTAHAMLLTHPESVAPPVVAFLKRSLV